ncbi:hypothetical protein SCP_1502380 [Sparassis crispa]|uniref:Uncharacterized protein n=1 Tax=Sparassis crispa TaxID=139825 RepID=A0A401H4F0_9APHY|nr:hypothetical protein SCP_1502380 [Sparassis crispa]GBE89230.1 hypothetical protein SCP_1502380 [Sparassis crispa]
MFPSAIDGDLLELVHLSYGLRLVDDAKHLQAGDVFKIETHIVSVINSNAGKTVRVKCFAIRGRKPVIEVVSTFLYHSNYSEYDNTFEFFDTLDYSIELATEADVLQSVFWMAPPSFHVSMQ